MDICIIILVINMYCKNCIILCSVCPKLLFDLIKCIYMYPKHVVMLDVLIFLSIKLILSLLFDMFCINGCYRGFTAEPQ